MKAVSKVLSFVINSLEKLENKKTEKRSDYDLLEDWREGLCKCDCGLLNGIEYPIKCKKVGTNIIKLTEFKTINDGCGNSISRRDYNLQKLVDLYEFSMSKGIVLKIKGNRFKDPTGRLSCSSELHTDQIILCDYHMNIIDEFERDFYRIKEEENQLKEKLKKEEEEHKKTLKIIHFK